MTGDPHINGVAYVVVVDPVAHFFNYIPAAAALGYKTIVLSSNEEVCRAEKAGHTKMVDDEPQDDGIDVFLTYKADDVESALKALAPYQNDIAGLVAGDEVTVRATAAIGRTLGFDYATVEDAACQQVKSLMKKRLHNCDVSTPRFAVVESLEDALREWYHFGGDCMVKMDDYAMSYGVSRPKTERELITAWNSIDQKRIDLDHGFATSNAVVLEEHIGGREFSIEGYEQEGHIEILNFCEKLTHSNFMVVGHYIPARTDASEAAALNNIAQKCVQALGISNSVFHAEVHVQDGQPYVIECASRPPGQYSVGVMERVYGFDLMQLSINLACRNPIDIRARPPNKWSAIMALYSDKTGIIRKIEALDKLCERAECYDLKCSVAPGDAVHQLETFRDVLGLALLEASDPHSIREVYDWARAAVQFRV